MAIFTFAGDPDAEAAAPVAGLTGARSTGSLCACVAGAGASPTAGVAPRRLHDAPSKATPAPNMASATKPSASQIGQRSAPPMPTSPDSLGAGEPAGGATDG